MRVEAWFLHKWFEVIGLFLCVCMCVCVCVTDRVNVRKKDSEENSHCCPQQPNLSSSALLTMKLPGKRFSKITNTAHMHTHTRTHTHAHTHARMQTAHTHMLTNQNRLSKSYKKTVWGKNSPRPFPAIRGLLFQHLVATGLRSECWASQTKQGFWKLIPSYLSSRSISSFCFSQYLSPLIFAEQILQPPKCRKDYRPDKSNTCILF